MRILLSVVALTFCAVVSDLILDKDGSGNARFAKLAVTLTVLCTVFLPLVGKGELSRLVPFSDGALLDPSRFTGNGEYSRAFEAYELSDKSLTDGTESECEGLLFEKIKAETGIIPKEVDIELDWNGEEGVLSVNSVRVVIRKEDAAFSQDIAALASKATGGAAAVYAE